MLSEDILNNIYNHFNDQEVIKTIYEKGYDVNLVFDDGTIVQHKFDTMPYQNKNDIHLYLTLRNGTAYNLYHLSRNNVNIYLHINRIAIICFNSNQLEGLRYCLKDGATINYLLKYDQINANINHNMYQLLLTYHANFNLLSLNHLVNIINDNNVALFLFLVKNGLDLNKANYLLDVINIHFIETLLSNDINTYATDIINFIILQLLTIYYK
jgi:hypothetical protein